MVSAYVGCILKQSDKMNKQKHIVDVKKNTVWYPALSRLVSVSQTGEGTSHFRATDLDRKSLFGYV